MTLTARGYILGRLTDTFYDMYEVKYVNITAKELWDDLYSKYKMEDAKNKKFLISKLFDFRMIDSKSIITQIHELQMLMNLIISEGHSLDKSFQVSTIISKLPLAWKQCRKELKQKKDAMTMQELVKSIQVEENSRNLDKLNLEDNKSSKALVVDQGSPNGSKQYLGYSTLRFGVCLSVHENSQREVQTQREVQIQEKDEGMTKETSQSEKRLVSEEYSAPDKEVAFQRLVHEIGQQVKLYAVLALQAVAEASIPCWSIRGCQPMCNSWETCDHNAQGHRVGKKD
ncbi:hypothetical protein RJ639_006229 [Escallonia herrerae]|uniref:Zinc finger, CCHC-type n=1 Tax=Escallonia herrerae TaxID=1293975 RepID=A0AA88VWW9_9ASTE|nr:hypothetical protein RJ639_006229 [Escallonia herrerae]